MNTYCPQHDAGTLLIKAGFYPKKGRGYINDITKDKRLHALLNMNIIEMHLDICVTGKHQSSKNASQVNNMIQKLQKIDNLKFFNLYQE